MTTKHESQLPRLGGVQPMAEKKPVTIRQELDVVELSHKVKAAYAAEGLKISNDAIYMQAMREYWTPRLPKEHDE